MNDPLSILQISKPPKSSTSKIRYIIQHNNTEFISYHYRSPEGIYLKQLVPADGQKINDLWPHAHNGSLYFIQRLIEMNLNIGAFTKEEDELIAWCLRYKNKNICIYRLITVIIVLPIIESKWEASAVFRSMNVFNVAVSVHWWLSSCHDV